MISVKSDPQLTCPECGEDQAVPEAELAVGYRLHCEHCGAESRLSHYRESADQPPAWRLESLLAEEEERRTG
ncbi:MAG: hypothetical protein ACM3ZT_03140 [Bacillota bacterium]